MMFAKLMLARVLSGGIVAFAAVLLLASHAPPRAEAASLFVFNPANSGFGTFRWAVEKANEDPSINLIVLKNSIPITLYSEVEYTGPQNLTIQGDKPLAYRVIQGDAGDSGVASECALFRSTGGADLSFYQVTFQNTECNAIEVYADSGDGEVIVTLNKTIIRDTSGYGLYMYEGGDGTASFKLNMTSSRVEDTGYSWGSGVRVDESGEGGITATIAGSAINRSGGDGLHLNEEDNGDITLTVSNSQFNDNGTNSESIVNTSDDEEVTVASHTDGDGFEAEENGAGKIAATFTSPVQANGNGDNGISLDEEDSGDLSLTATGITANGNDDDGIDTDERDTGNETVKLTTVQTWYNWDDGVDVYEDGDGDVSFQASGSSANSNSSDGYELYEEGNGNFSATFNTVVANANDDDGFDLEEWGDGSFMAQILGSTATFNDDEAVEASADGATGTIAFGTSTLLGGINLDNVNSIP